MGGPGIVEENIDVVAFPMIDHQHQRGSAPEAPARRKVVGPPEMIEDTDRHVKQGRPLTWSL